MDFFQVLLFSGGAERGGDQPEAEHAHLHLQVHQHPHRHPLHIQGHLRGYMRYSFLGLLSFSLSFTHSFILSLSFSFSLFLSPSTPPIFDASHQLVDKTRRRALTRLVKLRADGSVNAHA